MSYELVFLKKIMSYEHGEKMEVLLRFWFRFRANFPFLYENPRKKSRAKPAQRKFYGFSRFSMVILRTPRTNLEEVADIWDISGDIRGSVRREKIET